MSTLNFIEKQQFEKLLGMESGYVSDFTNRTFRDFMQSNAAVDIYSKKYAGKGDSKANRLRSFWEMESDLKVGQTLASLVNYWNFKNPQPDEPDKTLCNDCQRIAERLLGKSVTIVDTEEQFLGKDLSDVSVKKVTTDMTLEPILESRFSEAMQCLKNDAPLAAIFLCGSILEGLLLSAATSNPKKFNEAQNSPKDGSGKVKKLHDWKLSEFIDVACEVGLLSLDVKKFSHVLRDFRNYIHPYQQMSTHFKPDEHTARICFQVLRAAIACLSGERSWR